MEFIGETTSHKDLKGIKLDFDHVDDEQDVNNDIMKVKGRYCFPDETFYYVQLRDGQQGFVLRKEIPFKLFEQFMRSAK